MDINDFRGLITAITMIAFLAVCFLAFSRHRKADYEESAKLPLEDDNYITENAVTENAREKL